MLRFRMTLESDTTEEKIEVDISTELNAKIFTEEKLIQILKEGIINKDIEALDMFTNIIRNSNLN